MNHAIASQGFPQLTRKIKSSVLCAVVAGIASIAAPQLSTAQTTVRVGSTPSSAPTGFLDTKTQKYVGLMPDVAEEVAKRAKITMQYRAIPNNALTQALIAGKLDLIAAGLSPTPVRAKVIDFSQPVTNITDGIIIKDSNKRPYRNPSDFANQKIGVLAGTDYVDHLKALNVTQDVKLYDTAADMARDVELGRIDVGIDDYPKLKYQELTGGFKGMHVVDSYQPMAKDDVIAFAVQKGNTQLLNKVNAALDSMKADGTLDALLKKWHWHGN